MDAVRESYVLAAHGDLPVLLWDHGLGPEYAKARPDGTPCDPGCACCRADGGCGECASDHGCEFVGDYGYCTSCEAKFPGDDGLIEY
mgnify:CR=1 FL=1